jgi:hypothetical protein
VPSGLNIFFGIVGIVGGLYVVKEAYYLNHHIYFLAWFERKFGPGMGTIAYRWIGLGVILFSIFVLTGRIDLAGSAGLERRTPSATVNQSQIIPPGGTDVRIAP